MGMQSYGQFGLVADMVKILKDDDIKTAYQEMLDTAEEEECFYYDFEFTDEDDYPNTYTAIEKFTYLIEQKYNISIYPRYISDEIEGYHESDITTNDINWFIEFDIPEPEKSFSKCLTSWSIFG
jgi:hypothetical protein